MPNPHAYAGDPFLGQRYERRGVGEKTIILLWLYIYTINTCYY